MKILIIGLLLTSCATKTDWKKEHYETSNEGARCINLCATRQFQRAVSLGCSCDFKGEELKQFKSIVSSSNGNTNTIYINNGQNRNTRQPASNYGGFIKAFETIYNQERNDRLNRVCNFNGTCKK